MRSRLRWHWEGILFLLRNLRHSAHVPAIPTVRYEDVEIRGMTRADMTCVDRLQRMLRAGQGWNTYRRCLYAARGRRLVTVAIGPDRQIIAFQMLYFREEEVQRSILHEAFIGVCNEWQGRKVATRIRRHVLLTLAGTGLTGVSSQITEDNVASLASAIAAGASEIGRSGSTILLLYPLSPPQPSGRANVEEESAGGASR